MRGCAAGEQLAGADAAGQGLEQREHTSPLSKERVLGQQCEHQTGSENRGRV